uniref:Homeobox domain-containing protein n=1 Tax=Panagrellus redivivus TaxID=6233 RepID=A0A7E4VV51_PANRE
MPTPPPTNFSIEKLLSTAKSFSPSAAAMMLNAQHAFSMAFNAMPSPQGMPMDFFNPYAFPATTSLAPQNMPFLLPPFQPYFGHPGMYAPAFSHLTVNGKRKRRHRTNFTEMQLAILEEAFAIEKFPNIAVREELAAKCQLNENRIEVWFKNRRAKDKKQKASSESSDKTGENASPQPPKSEESDSSDGEHVVPDQNCNTTPSISSLKRKRVSDSTSTTTDESDDCPVTKKAAIVPTNKKDFL